MGQTLEEYHYLMEHDNIDCSAHMSGENFQMKCWQRRYGMPLISLAMLMVYGYFMITNTIRNQDKKKKVGLD